MSAPVYKQLLIRPTDLGGNPLGVGSQVADFEVTAVLDRYVSWGDHHIDAGQPLADPQPSGPGGVTILVPCADDPGIIQGANFGIVVTLVYEVAGESRRRVVPSRMVSVTTVLVDDPAGSATNPNGPDVVYYGNLSDATPPPEDLVDLPGLYLSIQTAINSYGNAAGIVATTANTAVNNALNTAGLLRYVSGDGTGYMVPGAENDTLFFDKDGRYTKLGIDQAGEVSDLTVGSLLGKGLLGSSDDGGGPGARFYGNNGQPSWLGFNAAGLPDATVIGYIVATVGVFGGPTPPEWLPPGAVVTWFKTDASSGELLDVLRLVA